jgi:glutamyl/glutaminyl-tRNA synthetase
MKVAKTRIAPTPSGFLHVGNILNFSLTAGLARETGAGILLRIDDLDRERADVAFLEDIFETLRFLELPREEGPVDVEDFETNWSQVRRMGLYERALAVLREKGAVFACSCSRAELARLGGSGYPGTCRDRNISLDAPEVNWRLKTDGSDLPDEMRDFVVRKKDGFPAYQLSSVVDDIHFGIDLVVRGEDLRASTAAQRYLASVLGVAEFERVRFVHHPLLMAEDGGKLSKSAGATSIQYLHKQGYSAADVFAYIGRLLGLPGEIRDWGQLYSSLRMLALAPSPT